jgi:hypothetical protein
MKRFLPCIILTLTVNAYCQQVLGVGELIIGISSEQFLKLSQINSKYLRERPKLFEKPNHDEIIRLTDGTIYDMYTGGQKLSVPKSLKIFSPDVVRYQFVYPLGIPRGSEGDTYEIRATFYKDKLSDVVIDRANLEFKRLLTEKYGKPVSVNSSKMEMCQNSFGAKSEHMTGVIRDVWGGDGEIQANFSVSSSNCGKYSAIRYSVSSALDLKEIDKIQNEGERKLEELELKAKSIGSKL